MKSLLTQEIADNSRGVILIRHAETAMNDKDVSRGWSDVPLDPDTYDKLVDLGKSLKQYKPKGIIASDLLRTLQTAKCVSNGSGIPIIRTTSFLHTWNTGEYTGQDATKVDAILQDLAANNPYKTIKGGESFEEFKHRFLLGLVSCLNEHPGELLVFVTHGRNLACLNAWANENCNEDLEVDPENLGYENYEPGSAHYFKLNSSLLK